jgi:hypothetical protein
VLDIEDLGALGDFADWEDVAEGEGRAGAAFDRLAGREAFRGDHQRPLKPGAICALENKLGERGTTAGVMQKSLDDAGDLGRALGRVKRPELGGTLAVVSVSFENVTIALSLSANDVPHGDKGRPKPS